MEPSRGQLDLCFRSSTSMRRLRPSSGRHRRSAVAPDAQPQQVLAEAPLSVLEVRAGRQDGRHRLVLRHAREAGGASRGDIAGLLSASSAGRAPVKAAEAGLVVLDAFAGVGVVQLARRAEHRVLACEISPEPARWAGQRPALRRPVLPTSFAATASILPSEGGNRATGRRLVRADAAFYLLLGAAPPHGRGGPTDKAPSGAPRVTAELVRRAKWRACSVPSQTELQPGRGDHEGGWGRRRGLSRGEELRVRWRISQGRNTVAITVHARTAPTNGLTRVQ